MSRINLDDNRCTDLLIASGFKLGRAEYVPATDYQITSEHPPVLALTPAGAVNVRLPASTEETKGMVFFIDNPSASTITFQTSTGAAFTPAIAAATTVRIVVQCTGAAGANGWRIIN